MKSRTIVMVVLLLALSLSVVSTASADEISGSGTIWASGAGQAVLRGHGDVRVHCRGVGIVWVKNAEVQRASGNGHKWEAPGGGTVYWGWSGTVHVAGSDVTVWMRGGLIEFTASGTGRVYLQGRGTYRINGQEASWSSTGEALSLEAVEQAG